LNDNKVVLRELGNYVAANKLNKQETRQIVKITRKNFDIDETDLKDNIATTIKLKALEEDKVLDNRLSEVYKTLRATLKKSILGIRISLNNIDDIAEELESIQYENSRYGWIINEIIMQNRFRLHEQLDLLLKQNSKLSRLYEKERVELSASH
jgi:hypothetical protein